jgi:ParB/RepB/Spo0J family partition protein
MARKKLDTVPITSIKPNEAALRAVDKESAKFQEMIQSVRSKGVIQPVSVREKRDQDNGTTYYELIDGLHRYTAALEVGLDELDVKIMDANDEDSLIIQMIANLQVIETKPVEYADQLKRLLTLRESLTINTLAAEIGQSVTWLANRLRINDLKPNIKKLVDNGDINISNAQALAKRPEDEQDDWAGKAQTMTPVQFVPLASARAKELKDAKKQGKAPPPKEFVPQPYMQNISVVRDEIDSLQIGKSLLHDQGVTDAVGAWQLALRWVLHMDPRSLEIEIANERERKRKADEAKEARKAELKEKKDKEAAQKQAALAG